MNWYEKIRRYIRKEWLLVSLLLLAFFLRVAGLGYGLPLPVVNDEATFTLGTLLMIKLHTLIPSLHTVDFQNVLYYPPYTLYLLLVPFVIILGAKYLLWHGDPALFQFHLIQDLSPFFMTARFLNLILGTITVYLVYRIAHTLYRSKIAAAAAAFLLATSLLHVALSMVGRQWLPAAFFFTLTFFFLTKSGWSIKRRYLTSFIVAGIGMGFSSICALACVLIGFYYLAFDASSRRSTMRDLPLIISGAVTFCVLSVVSWLLYHGGNTFTGSVTLHQQKTILGLLESPISAISLMVFSEPILVALSIGGLIFCAFFARRLGTLMAAFFAVYVVIFYIFFRFEPRFFVPLVPFLAMLGGFTIVRLWDRRSAALLCLLLLIPGIVAIRLSYLALQGDTRERAREWVIDNLKSNDRVLVFSSSLHVPTQRMAVEELRSIEPTAIRKVDEADAVMDNHDVPYVLNSITSINNPEFTVKFPQYAKQHRYNYLVIESRSLPGMPAMARGLMSLTADASIVARFDGFEAPMSVWESSFTKPFTQLFDQRLLGPNIVIYRLNL